MMLRQCCECKKIWVNDQWIYPRLSQLEGQDISHGYCESCHQKELASIRRRRAAKQGQHTWIWRLFHCHG